MVVGKDALNQAFQTIIEWIDENEAKKPFENDEFYKKFFEEISKELEYIFRGDKYRGTDIQFWIRNWLDVMLEIYTGKHE